MMPEAKVGMMVLVDMAEDPAGGVSMGTVTDVSAAGVVVKLDAPIAGVDRVTVDASNVKVI